MHRSHEWDPSVLDYTHPATAGDPTWAQIPPNAVHMTPGLMNLAILRGEFTTPSLIPPGNSHIAQHKHAIKTQPIDFEKLRPYFGWVNKHTIRKPSTKPLNGLLPPLGIQLGNISSPDSQLSTSRGDLKRLLLIPSSQTPLPLTLVLPWHRILLEKEL